MKLRRGITGFVHVNDPPLPKSELVKVSEHCHTVARMIGGTVHIVEPPSVAASVCPNLNETRRCLPFAAS